MDISASTPICGFMMTTLAFACWARASLDPRGNTCSPSAMGGSAISYANVASYEVDIGGQTVHPTFHDSVHLGLRDIVPVEVCNPKRLVLNSYLVDKISINMEDFLDIATIILFKGFWPSLLSLHAWISHVWEPFISETAQIYPLDGGFLLL